MNKLKSDQQVNVISALVEGNSIRSIERMTGIHRDTIMRLGVRVGEGCQRLLDREMHDLSCTDIQVDELWCFVGKKQRHVTNLDNPLQVGDTWTFVGIDRDTKLVPSFLVGKRTLPFATKFMKGLSSRLSNRVQISSDGLRAYVQATEEAFGANVDYAQIVKSYEAEPIGPDRYSPPKIVNTESWSITGDPIPSRICTSHVERLNLTLRMSSRRFTRLTNAFSKKLENLKAAVALHFAHYNFVRIHSTLRVTPCMEAGLSTHIWTIKELLEATNDL